jgi:hypothetical protein
MRPPIIAKAPPRRPTKRAPKTHVLKSKQLAKHVLGGSNPERKIDESQSKA